MKIIVFDTETTCLDMDKIEVWQLSGLKIDFETRTTEKFNLKYKTSNPLSYEARKRCNITQEEVDSYKPFDVEEVIKTLELGNQDIYYVGHNIKFDRQAIISVVNRFSNYVVDIFGDAEVSNLSYDKHWICTMLLAKRLWNDVIVEDISGSNPLSFALDFLFHYFHLYNDYENLNFHDAMFDVEVTWRLFKKICGELNLKPQQDMEKISELSNSPFKLTYIGFGKYKGHKWTDVYVNDKRYLNWMIANMDIFDKNSPSFDANIYYTVEQL